MDSGICETSTTASPAEPRGLPFVLVRAKGKESGSSSRSLHLSLMFSLGGKKCRVLDVHQRAPTQLRPARPEAKVAETLRNSMKRPIRGRSHSPRRTLGSMQRKRCCELGINLSRFLFVTGRVHGFWRGLTSQEIKYSP